MLFLLYKKGVSDMTNYHPISLLLSSSIWNQNICINELILYKKEDILLMQSALCECLGSVTVFWVVNENCRSEVSKNSARFTAFLWAIIQGHLLILRIIKLSASHNYVPVLRVYIIMFSIIFVCLYIFQH